MEANLSIGVFSRMTFVSVKALRHYDEIGLLAPAWVDPDSGYRHYSAAQVPVAQVIRRLRDLGMPLDKIMAVVHARDVDTATRPSRPTARARGRVGAGNHRFRVRCGRPGRLHAAGAAAGGGVLRADA